MSLSSPIPSLLLHSSAVEGSSAQRATAVGIAIANPHIPIEHVQQWATVAPLGMNARRDNGNGALDLAVLHICRLHAR